MQCVNNLIVIIIIQKMHNSLKCAVYTTMIVYFKKLMKHLNAEKTINIAKITLFDSCFNEWYREIEIMLLTVKAMSLLQAVRQVRS